MSLGRVLKFDLFCFALVILVSIFLKDGAHPNLLTREFGPITWISFLQLFLTGRIAWKLFKRREPHGFCGLKKISSPAFVWAICAFGFYFLSVDEMVTIHEKLDVLIYHGLPASSPSVLSQRDDLSIVLYGIIGLSVLLYFWKELYGYKRVWPVFVGGFFCMALSVGFDFLSHQKEWIVLFMADSGAVSRWVSAIEEGFKLFAGGFFLSAFYGCFNQTKPRH